MFRSTLAPAYSFYRHDSEDQMVVPRFCQLYPELDKPSPRPEYATIMGKNNPGGATRKNESAWVAEGNIDELTQRDPYHLIAGGFTLFFSIWTIYCNALVYAHANFSKLILLSIIPLLLTCLIARRLLYMSMTNPCMYDSFPTVNNRQNQRYPFFLSIPIAACITAIYYLTGNYILFWALSAVFLMFIYFSAPGPLISCSLEKPSNRISTIFPMLLAISVALVTLISHRVDQDDSFYVNLIVTALDFPDRPLLQNDGIFGINGLPLLMPIYRVHSYELFNSFIARLTNLTPLFIYHMLLPTLMAPMVIVANWLLIRKFQREAAVFSVLFTVVVMLAWGDVHRTYGNFSFVRLFQGKGVLVSVCIPLVIYYAFEYVQRRDFPSWMFLCLAQIAAYGFSSSGLVVAPLAASTVLLGSMQKGMKYSKTLLAGIACCACPLIAALLFSPYHFHESIAIAAPAARLPFHDSGHFLSEVLGKGTRAYLALFAVLLSPVLVSTGPKMRLITGYVLATWLFIMNPVSSWLLSNTLASVFSWRLFWALPFPALIGLTAGGITHIKHTSSIRYSGVVVFFALMAGYIVLPEPWTLSPRNHTQLSMPHYKVDNGYDIAAVVVNLTPFGGTVLAPSEISDWIPTFPRHPYPLAVRFYLNAFTKFLGEQENQTREELQQFINGEQNTMDLKAVIIELVRRKIDTVVFPKDFLSRKAFSAELERLGYKSLKEKGYEIWIHQHN